MSDHDTYSNPLAGRYASEEMLRNFSDNARYRLWRDLWIALAEAEGELGLDISGEQIAEMKRARDTIDYDRVAVLEADLRHDVMAHIRAFAECCPSAGPIIHLGATSCDITDNADLILMKRALEILRDKLVALLGHFRAFALAERSHPALAYTHLQPAQLTTVGKRAALWAQDFFLDLKEVAERIDGLRFRGVKATTGTQASFLRLFDGDTAKVEELDRRITEKMGFREHFRVTGQTYSRKVDDAVLHALSGLAQSAHKFSTDVRIQQGFGELEEPFGSKQVGSSAMPYKRNPMRCERISSLAKFLICESQNAAWIQATQWFERTLDDSAARRIAIPQAFLAADAILVLCISVVRGLVAYPEVIRRRIGAEFPFMASEDVLMLAVRAGGDRQVLHERIREHAMRVAEDRKLRGAPNDLLERIAADPYFAAVKDRIAEVGDPERHIGRAPQQVELFFREEVDPFLSRLSFHSERKSWEVKV